MEHRSVEPALGRDPCLNVAMLSLEEIFPPFALRITCGPVELRVLRDDDLPELVDLIQGGIHHPDLPMPFLFAWHEIPYRPGEPDGFPASSLSFWWTQRATFSPDRWQLALTVRHNGVLVGMQDLMTRSFPQTRSVDTGSWLGLPHHGKGIGTLMRQLAVGFAFDELGAVECTSVYFEGNHASAAVSRKVGYVDNGHQRNTSTTSEGETGVVEHRVVVTPDTFIRPDADVRVEGAEALRRFLAIDR